MTLSKIAVEGIEMVMTHNFHETLEQLRLLQSVLNEKFELEKKISELPKELQLKADIVFRMKENFLITDNRYQELKKNLTLKRDELEKLQSKREKYEKEIAHVNSQRDYEQIDRAIKENLEQEKVVRNELHALESQIDMSSEEFQDSEVLLKEQEHALKEMKEQVAAQLEDSQKLLAEMKTREDAITDRLDNKLVIKFERIVKSKGGDGIVPIKKNICNGCHMILPLQFVNDVCKEEEVLNCPYCSKILYYNGDTVTEELEQVEVSGLQDLFEDESIDFEDEDYDLFSDENKDNIGSDGYVIDSEDNSDENEDDDALEDDAEDDELDDELVADDLENENNDEFNIEEEE